MSSRNTVKNFERELLLKKLRNNKKPPIGGFLLFIMREMEESNPRQCFWRALLYHLTNLPIYPILQDYWSLGKTVPRDFTRRGAGRWSAYCCGRRQATMSANIVPQNGENTTRASAVYATVSIISDLLHYFYYKTIY